MITYLNQAWQDTCYPNDADLVICDPIYNDSDLTYVGEMARTLRPGGSMYLFADMSGVGNLAYEVSHFMDLELQNWIIWGPNDWGGRSKRRWGQKHDDLLFLTKRGAPHYFDGEAVAIPKKMTQAVFNPSGRTTKIPSSVWDDLAGFSTVAKERVRIDGKAVPWQKPERVIERIVLASSAPGDLVLDPFGGVGTVPLICGRHGRNCVSTEIDFPTYAAGSKRLQNFLDMGTTN